MEEGATVKERGWPVEARKGEEIDIPLELLEGMQPCQHFDFSIDQ